MPRFPKAHPISPKERRREVAAILARGVLRLHRSARIGGVTPDPECQSSSEKGLEVLPETGLSASGGTRGLRLRDDGDDV